MWNSLCFKDNFKLLLKKEPVIWQMPFLRKNIIGVGWGGKPFGFTLAEFCGKQ